MNELKKIYLLYKLHRKNNSISKSFLKTFNTIFTICRISFSQYYLKNVHFITKNEYDIKYMFNGSYYKIKIKGSNNNNFIIDKIENDKNEDISLKMFEYLGPKFNFHNIEYRPIDFNHKMIKIYYTNNTFDIFEEKDIIIIKK
jgi:hypothetical protein